MFLLVCTQSVVKTLDTRCKDTRHQMQRHSTPDAKTLDTRRKAVLEFYIHGSVHRSYINKIQQDATVCRYLFTAKSLYVFWVFIAPHHQEYIKL